MQREAAIRLISQTLEQPFNGEQFQIFVRNLLNRIEAAPFTYRGNYIYADFRDRVDSLERIGKYQDKDGNKLDILVVKLKRDTSLERARATQRKFVAKYLKGSRGSELKDAALVAFVSPNDEDWRFSFVKMDYKIETSEKGSIRVREEFTPARRYSFLVGKNESSHTAQSRLLPILQNTDRDPTLSDLEESFSIERVTREFFEQYRALYHEIEEKLDKLITKDKEIRDDFQEKGVDTIDFSKKLLGQIVFLYFLQKKGWFGVGKRSEWGTGPKRFLRELFEKRHGDYKNFFNDILEPLFYNTLAVERDGDYADKFDCRIPFLNGGLFDPINNYDWQRTDILLPDELFSNQIKTKQGDVGTGILDIFDRYNFTVKEDEPLEKEVAVDPEMLGKVFENLLEVKDRKSKGTYYTPREIVHYMCQESLVNYLTTELEGTVRIEDVETLIKHGESALENDAFVSERGEEKGRYRYKLPDSVRNNAELIDQKLAGIKVCDPAVGSGAFLVGMMAEIVRARVVLSQFLATSSNRTPYGLKRHAIQNCLYGVDLDLGAVEIAKLRLWLSLIVDEADYKHIKPLPNLDYKIMQGNSLLSVEKNLFNQRLFEQLEELKPLFFKETSVSKKKKYKGQIDELIGQITNGLKDFDFKVYFSEIFHEKKGFDVVIANPPYVRQEQLKDIKPALKNRYRVFTGTADIYTYFFEAGFNILRQSGILTFITSNKYMRANYGANLRRFLKENSAFRVLIDFGDLPVFDATAYPSIIVIQKADTASSFLACSVRTLDELQQLEKTLRHKAISMSQASLPDASVWNIEEPHIADLRMKLQGTSEDTLPLKEYVKGQMYRGILTGYNKAFVIDDVTRKRLIKEDSKSAEVIKPFLRGRDIKRYNIGSKDLFVIYIANNWTDQHRGNQPPEKFLQQSLPAIYRHLKAHEAPLKKRDDQGRYWWELRACAYLEEFERPKIVWGNLATKPQFAFDTDDHYISAPACILPSDDLFLLTLLNSRLCGYMIESMAALRAQNYLEFKPMYVERIPIRIPSEEERKQIEAVVTDILKLKQQGEDTTILEREIDQLVYELYGLTEEEIAIVKGPIPEGPLK